MDSYQIKQKKYKTLGICIYCLKEKEIISKEENKLTDEHIIAHALNGEHIFKEASCLKCAAYINKSFEQDALKKTLLTPKMVLELKRRKKNREPLRPYPIAINLDVDRMRLKESHTSHLLDKEFYNVVMEPKENPPIFFLPQFPPAGFITKPTESDGFSALRVQFIKLKSFNEWAIRHSIYQVGVHVPAAPVTFALSIVKIAYSFAIAELGVCAFDGTLIRDLILGKRKDISNFVGLPTLERNNLTKKYLHNLYIRREKEYCTVLVHLFASYNAMPYQVVVGKYL